MLKRTFSLIASSTVLLGINNNSYAAAKMVDPEAAEIKARVKAEAESLKIEKTIDKEEIEMEQVVNENKIRKGTEIETEYKALRNRHDSSKNKLSAEEEQKMRKMWNYNSGSSEVITPSFLADSGAYYDKWQQAYRILGVYIDCDHPQSSNTWDYDNNPYYTENVNNAECARYYIWCAYVDPNYQGGGRSEYADGDSDLDCHNDDTGWQLLGCYRQEMYNTIEQLSKHIWSAYDEEYETACSSLDYMTKYDCRQVGYDSSGNVLYAGVQPIEGGYFQMGLYEDSNCLILDESSGYTYDDFYTGYEDYGGGGSGDGEGGEGGGGGGGGRDLGSQDNAHYDYGGDYTMEGINEIMDGFKYCSLCMDYPTYQDGSENGGDAYDDDNLINQCWKFWSHASYPCNTDCIAMASAQGTLLSVEYGSFAFGMDSSSFSYSNDGSSGSSSSTSTSSSAYGGNESNFEKMKANAFLILAGVVFLTTFLSFGIARSSLHKSNETISGNTRLSKSKSRKSRSKSRTSVSGEKSRSKSRSRRMLDEDYEKEKSRARRSKSRTRQRSQSRSRKRRDEEESRGKSRSPSKTRNSRPSKYEAPSIPDGESQARKSSRRGQRREDDRARRQRDDF